MTRIPRFSQRSLYTITRRSGFLFRRLVTNRFIRDKHVRIIYMGGRVFKRVTFPDTHLAAQAVANHAPFRDLGIFPRILAVEDHELVVEFIEGTPLSEQDFDAQVEGLSRFFTSLYGTDRHLAKLSDTDFVYELRRDLDFLCDVGVLESAARDELRSAADAIAPNEVWVGHDFHDSLLKNLLVVPDGRIIAIDIEAVTPKQLVGEGVAKVLLRVLPEGRDRLLDSLAERAGLDLRPAMPFIEMHFLGRWMKHAYLKGRHNLVDGRLFDPYRNAGAQRD